MKLKNRDNFIVCIISFVIIYTYFQYFLKDMLSENASIVLIDDIFILGLFVVGLIKIIINKESIRSKYNIIFLLLIAEICLSAIANKVPLANFLLGAKGYLLYIAFYYVIKIFVQTKEQVNTLLRTLVFCAVIQTLFNFPQMITAISEGVMSDDLVHGTFGNSGANAMSYSLFFMFFYLLTELLMRVNKETIIISIITGFNFIIGFGKAAFGMFPVIFIFINRQYLIKGKYFKRGIVLLCLFILLLSIFSMMNGSKYEYKQGTIFEIFNFSFLYDHFTQSEMNVYNGSARNLWYKVTLNRLNVFSASPMIGMGPGMYASYAAFNLMPPQNMSIYNIFHQIELGMDAGVDSQIIPIWGELGYMGVMIFLLIFVIIYANLNNIYKKCKTIETQVLALTGMGGCIFMLLGFYINHFWEMQTICITFFVFLSLAERSFEIERNIKLETGGKNFELL